MNVEFAIEYAKRRMKELGYGDEFIIRWRHLQLSENETVVLPGNNEFYLLINPVAAVKVSSKTGVYDQADGSINEMQYEHRGKTVVQNKEKGFQFVLFIQLIPNHLKTNP